MARRFRSGRRFPDPTPDLDPAVTSYISDLVRSLNDLEVDVPFLPINNEPFIATSTQESYTVSSGSTTAEIADTLGTLLLKLKNSGIIL